MSSNFGHDPGDGHAHLLPGIFSSRIPMNTKEASAVDELIGIHGRDLAGFTRRDALNTGPLLVELHDGTRFEVGETGHVTEIPKAGS